MKFKLLLISTIVFSFLISCSENKSEKNTSTSPSIQWQKSFGGYYDDVAYSIQQTSDSGYIAAGYSASNDGDVTENYGKLDIWVVKLNSAGIIRWQKTLGGSSNEQARSIQQTNDGGCIVAGYSGSNDGNIIGNKGGYDCLIVKLDPFGKILWQKSFGGAMNDYAYSIQQTNDDGYVVAGSTGSNDGDVSGYHGSFDFWVVKLDSTGGIQWQKSLGGSGFDEAKSIRQTSDGGYIVAGVSDSKDGDVSGNHGEQDFWVLKLNSTGEIQWQKSLGGSSKDKESSNGEDYAFSIRQTKEGGYIAAGYSGSNDGDISENHGKNFDAWVVKLSSTGKISWQKSLGGNSSDDVYSIQQTKEGGYIFAGHSDSKDGDVSGNHGDGDFWVVKLNSDGCVIWQKSLGGSGLEEAHSIQQTIDGGYIAAGYSYSNDKEVSGNHGNSDFWIVKLK